MDSLKFAEFLFPRIQETIDNKQYITEVSIDFAHAETYGNDYIQVSYKVKVNEEFEGLGYDEKKSLFQHATNYTFSLSTNKARVDSKKKMLRILEFRHIYESLASYAVLQLEKYLNATTSIKVKGVDMWPDGNYAEKYLIDLQRGQRRRPFRDFEMDVFQWKRLYVLANESRKIYAKEKEQFNITDIQISQSFGFDLGSLRSLLLNNSVPIKIKGSKTIDEILIHTAKLVEVIKRNNTDNEYLGKHAIPRYKNLVVYLYNAHLPLKKAQIVKQQQSEYINHFIIQKGDILQLEDSRIVIANAVQFDEKNSIYIEYSMLKIDLQPSQRTRTIPAGQISYLLKSLYFLEFIHQAPVKHLSSLEKWMAKRKVKFDYQPFEPDLIRDMDSAEKN